MRHTIEEKHRLVMRSQNGESIAHICAETGIARSTFYSWVKPFQTTVTKAGVLVTPQAFDALRRKVEKQAAIIRVLKSVNCTVSAPLKEKLAALEPLYGQFSVHTLCDALEVSREMRFVKGGFCKKHFYSVGITMICDRKGRKR